MPMYPYMIPTTVLGYAYPYDTETNVSMVQPVGSAAFLHVPSPDTINAKRCYVVQPVMVAGKLDTEDGLVDFNEEMLGKQIGTTNTGAPIFLGYPINDTDMVDKKGLVRMDIPGLAGGALVIIILLVIFAIIAGMFIGNVAENIKQYHALDVALQLQKYTDQYLDVDTGQLQNQMFDGADIIVRSYANGEIIHIAMNDRGKAWLAGQNFQVIQEGIDTDALLGDIFNEDWMKLIQWAIIGVVAIAGVYIAIKILPGLFSKKGGGYGEYPQYYQPPPQYPPPSQQQYQPTYSYG